MLYCTVYIYSALPIHRILHSQQRTHMLRVRSSTCVVNDAAYNGMHKPQHPTISHMMSICQTQGKGGWRQKEAVSVKGCGSRPTEHVDYSDDRRDNQLLDDLISSRGQNLLRPRHVVTRDDDHIIDDQEGEPQRNADGLNPSLEQRVRI